MKLPDLTDRELEYLSLPSRGAWIEIGAALARRAKVAGSLPSRGAWIEMISTRVEMVRGSVAPLAGSVD